MIILLSRCQRSVKAVVETEENPAYGVSLSLSDQRSGNDKPSATATDDAVYEVIDITN